MLEIRAKVDKLQTKGGKVHWIFDFDFLQNRDNDIIKFCSIFSLYYLKTHFIIMS